MDTLGKFSASFDKGDNFCGFLFASGTCTPIAFNCKNIFDRYLTHLCLAPHKRDIGKQGAALNTGISIKHGNNKTGPNI